MIDASLHDLISRYCQWPPYHQRPVVTEKVTQVMTTEEYASEFGFGREQFNDIPTL